MSVSIARAEPGWFRRSALPSSSHRLFCFPYAGGSASLYRNWHDWLAPGIEVVAVELPGRGMHIGEPALDRMDVLVERLLTAMRPLLDRPFSLFGHSMGALIAFEASRQLAAIGGPEPQHLIVSGMGAPHLLHLQTGAPIHDLPDAEFMEALRTLNGTPPEVLANEGLVDCFLGMLRADFRVGETYRCDQIVRLRHPITAFGGVHDECFCRDDLEAWRHHTSERCIVRWLPGNHFFIREHEHQIAAALAALATATPDPDRDVAVA